MHARRLDKLISRADADNDSLALAGIKGLRKILRDVAELQGKLSGQLTVQVTLAESKEWQELRQVLQVVFSRYPEAGKLFLEYGSRRRWSALEAANAGPA